MIILVLLVLCALVAKLWADLGALRQRIEMLENGAPQHIEPAVAKPALDLLVQPAPEPAPLPPARIVRATIRPEPVEAPPVATADEPQPDPIPVEATATPAPAPVTPRPSFEDLFGRKLPIWAGGVTLAVCGFLIVRYSIDAGLLSPWVRVVGGVLFGLGLLGGAEASLRNEERVRDPRVRQALAGAGVATLYASVLVAANLYDLVPPLVAFAGLALVTVLAATLSIRFGPPSAVLGLVGGLAAPALVSTGQPHLPLLAGYLALAVGGLATLGRTQRWGWLAAAALTGGFGWGAALLVVATIDGGSPADALSIGALLLLLGIALPVLLFSGPRGWLARLLGLLAAAAQLAALVATGGFAMLHWGLFGLLGIAAVWLSRRERALADLPIPALAVALMLQAAWPAPSAFHLALVMAGTAAIFGLPAGVRVWRGDGRLSDAAAVAALSAATLGIPFLAIATTKPMLTALALTGAAAGGAAAAFGWRVPARREDARFVLLTATSAILLALAALIALPDAAVAASWAAIAAALVVLARHARDARVERFAWAAALAAVALYVATPGRADPLGYATGIYHRPLMPVEALRWALGAAAALVFAQFGRLGAARPVGGAAAVLFGYVAVAQMLPPSLMPLIPAIALATLGHSRRSDAATATAGTLALAWSAWPLAQWLGGTGLALAGVWLPVDRVPTLAEAATRLLAPALATAVVLRRDPPQHPALRRAALATAALLATAAVHSAFKQVFALRTDAQFVAYGLSERFVWEALLATAALACVKGLPHAARAFGLAALAHLAWFTLALHDPLWAAQDVGPLPVANLLLPTYALGFALLWAAGRAGLPPPVERARGWAQMALVLLLAASELRQLTHGSLLVHGNVGEGEDIARSVTAVAIAIGFLLRGIRTRARDWRIGSLVVMLAAVLKVFILDTSGLHGLIRIASFAALGFSLIGLGWLYSRTLPDDVNPVPTQA